MISVEHPHYSWESIVGYHWATFPGYKDIILKLRSINLRDDLIIVRSHTIRISPWAMSLEWRYENPWARLKHWNWKHTNQWSEVHAYVCKRQRYTQNRKTQYSFPFSDTHLRNFLLQERMQVTNYPHCRKIRLVLRRTLPNMSFSKILDLPEVPILRVSSLYICEETNGYWRRELDLSESLQCCQEEGHRIPLLMLAWSQPWPYVRESQWPGIADSLPSMKCCLWHSEDRMVTVDYSDSCQSARPWVSSKSVKSMRDKMHVVCFKSNRLL